MSGSPEKRVKKIRVLTNLTRLEQAGEGAAAQFVFRHYTASGPTAAFKAFFLSFRCDYILLNNSTRLALPLILLKAAVPFHRAKIVLLDILLSAPKTFWDRAKAWVLGRLLARTHRILLYYRNTEGLQRHYRIPASRFRYVPFKVNGRAFIDRTVPADGGYIFCGGKTRRDFDTLFAAVKELPYPVKVATTSNRDIIPHGSFVDEETAPANVEVIRLDGSPGEFISMMASSRLVVLPITPEICGAGISVYLQAMALRKCVIISAGPGAEDVLTSGQAIIVPPSDPAALRESIEKAFNDAGYREQVAQSGYEWANSLGGDEQLFSSILSHLHRDYTSAEHIYSLGSVSNRRAGATPQNN